MTHFTGMENPWEGEFDDHQIGLFLTFCDRLDAAGSSCPGTARAAPSPSCTPSAIWI